MPTATATPAAPATPAAHAHRLIIIPPSHYCEKASWALRLAGVPYTQEAHAPLLHAPAVKRAGGGRSTPVLVTPEGVLKDSEEILAWLEERPEAAWRPYGGAAVSGEERAAARGWEERLGRDLGPHTRRFAYFHILPLPRPLSLECVIDGAPAWERRWARLAWPLIRWVMRRSMRIDAAGAARSRERIDSCFEEVAADLAANPDGGGERLVGRLLTAADLTFATLAAPVLLAPGYGARLPPEEQLPAALRAEVARYRAHPAGRYALRVYEELARRAP